MPIPEPTWQCRAYLSGTQVVGLSYYAYFPHYHIGHLAADTEGDDGRHQVAQELCDWLNGGAEPWWMDHLSRVGPDGVKLPHGCEIEATGPMYCPNQPLLWEEDDRDDARIHRGLLVNALLKRERPQPPEASESHQSS